ncbi:MAG: hypothetical protein A2X40_05445 [Elusimicrobia bacterium GWC2_65_9]|nr:MAG: hypothetical protein A2X40_05445 [Elusimicrobia bacterium GWC2_65_9]
MCGLAAQRSSAASEKEFAKVINVAGRQRMLSQKMAAEFLLMKLGIAAEDNKKKMDADISTFDKSLASLSNGDGEAGIPAPPNEQISRQFAQVKLLWGSYVRALQSAGTSSVADIATLGDPILRESDKAVTMYEFAAEEAGIKKTGAVVNIAGRQRMLSQKMTKETCLIALGENKSEALSNLKSTRQLFETSHNALLKGSKELGIPATTQPEIKKQMAEVDGFWKQFNVLISEIITSGDSNAFKTAKIAELSQNLLTAMDKAVTLYAESGKPAAKS